MVVSLQVPVEWLAPVTDPAADSLLALTQLPGRCVPTPTKCRQDTSRIAVALFTNREVVKAFTAHVTVSTTEVVFALAFPIVVA